MVSNKSDLADPESVSRETLCISAKTGFGIDLIEAAIVERLGALTKNVGAPIITRARHRQGLERALTQLEAAIDHLKAGIGSEFVSEDVRLASRELGTLTGHVDPESVLGAVFSSFCIGK